MATMTFQDRIVSDVKIYFKTLASSTYVGFHQRRRQFIYKVLIFTREYEETKKNYLQKCMLKNRWCDLYINIGNRVKD